MIDFLTQWAKFFISSFIIFFCLRHVHWRAWTSFRRGLIYTDFTTSMALIGVWARSLLLWQQGFHMTGFETVAAVGLIVMVEKIIEGKISSWASESNLTEPLINEFKSKLGIRAEKICLIFTPLVILMAAGAALFDYFRFFNPHESFNILLAVLFSANLAILPLATKVSMMAGLKALASLPHVSDKDRFNYTLFIRNKMFSSFVVAFVIQIVLLCLAAVGYLDPLSASLAMFVGSQLILFKSLSVRWRLLFYGE